MRKKIPKADHKSATAQPEEIAGSDKPPFGSTDHHMQSSVRTTLQRYCTIAITAAFCIGGAMILFGFKPAGKGLILGTLFSGLNFILMARALPLGIGLGRRKSFFFSLGSVYFRYFFLALPLVFAFKSDLVAVFTVAVGLFMVQIAILGDQFWQRLRNPAKVNG